VISGYDNLHPVFETFNLKTRVLADYIPPVKSQISFADFDPKTNQLTIWGKNSVMEWNKVHIDITSGDIASSENEAATQFTNYTEQTALAVSADGTSVPITLLTPKGVTANAKTPLMVYAYGEYGTPAITSWMSREHIAPLLNRGYVIAFAHVRGGGDYGRSWMLAGSGQNKVRGIEDLEAVLKTLQQQGISNPDLTSIKGFSAGGSLVTMLLDRHPELFKTAFVEWGLSDSIDIVLDPKSFLGAVERGVPEGDPLDPKQFSAICARSALQNLDGVPLRNVVWITTSKDDIQLNPWLPMGYYTKVKQYTANVYLFVSQSGGHLGYASSDEKYTELASEYSLLESLR
jgi:protease II